MLWLYRGALVKALAVCSRRPYIQIFKVSSTTCRGHQRTDGQPFPQPILLLALEDYFNEPTPTVLKRMYEAINSIDTALAPSLSLDERVVLRCSERRDLFEEKFNTAEDNPLSPSATTTATTSTEDRPSHLGVPGGDADQQPRSRVASDNSNASAAGAARLSNGKVVATNGAKSKSLRDTHYFETSVHYNELVLPIRVPLYTFPDEVGDVSDKFHWA